MPRYGQVSVSLPASIEGRSEARARLRAEAECAWRRGLPRTDDRAARAGHQATGDAHAACLAHVGPGHVVVAEQCRRARPQRGPFERRERGSQRLGGHLQAGLPLRPRDSIGIDAQALPAARNGTGCCGEQRRRATATGFRRMVVSVAASTTRRRRTHPTSAGAASEHANVSAATAFEGVRPNVAPRPRLRRAAIRCDLRCSAADRSDPRAFRRPGSRPATSAASRRRPGSSRVRASSHPARCCGAASMIRASASRPASPATRASRRFVAQRRQVGVTFGDVRRVGHREVEAPGTGRRPPVAFARIAPRGPGAARWPAPPPARPRCDPSR